MRAEWYFDFVSPYSYFGLARLRELPAELEIGFHPVVFAALLDRWGQKGPAEIAAKRTWTYRSCTWWAAQHGVRFRFPAGHPFNSIPYLRLAIAAGNTRGAVERIFDALWTTGCDPTDAQTVAEVARALDVDVARLAEPEIKQALLRETDEAAAHGIFGVPTLRLDGEIFWGADATDFANAYIADPAILQTAEMKRVAQLRVAASRRGAGAP